MAIPPAARVACPDHSFTLTKAPRLAMSFAVLKGRPRPRGLARTPPQPHGRGPDGPGGHRRRSGRTAALQAAGAGSVTSGHDPYKATASLELSGTVLHDPHTTVWLPVDAAGVPHPRPIRALLAGPREQRPCGQGFETFLGCPYYATVRLVETAALRPAQCHPPDTGWGLLTLRQGAERAARNSPVDGAAHETRRPCRRVRARAVKDSPPVPSPPTSFRVLRQRFGTDGTPPVGRPFRSDHVVSRRDRIQEGPDPDPVERADRSEAAPRSASARRLYDLRHAGEPFWRAREAT